MENHREQDDAAAIVVGSGPSGLSVAACLHQVSIPYVMLEREDCIAPLWNKKAYDRLHLHLVKQVCQLPRMPFPINFPTYVPRKEFVQYMEDYASKFDIAPLFRRSVESAAYDESTRKWEVAARIRNADGSTAAEEKVEHYSARFLILATGETSDPFVPEIEGLSSFPGEVIHSTQYKNGDKYRNKNVLVVGAGNSGMEISLDLSNYGAKASIVVRSPIHVLSREMVHIGPSLVKYFPSAFKAVEATVVMLSKLWYGDLSKYGIQRPDEGPFTMKAKYGKFPVIDVGTCKKIKSGEIKVLPGIRSIEGDRVLFQNGKSQSFDVIIFATGFKRSTKEWLKGDDYLLNEDGFAKPRYPNHWKGENGLYCAGLARKGLFGAGMDAQNIANDINTKLSSSN